jgi:hypothetical protein
MSELITCPTGLSLEIRGLTPKEVERLTDPKVIRSGLFVKNMLEVATIAVTDPGIYGEDVCTGDPRNPVKWPQVLVGDCDYAWLRVAARSFGKVHQVNMKCPACRPPEHFTPQIDITALEVQELAAEDKASFAEGNRFKETLDDGPDFWFRLLVLDDIMKIEKAKAAGAKAPTFSRAVALKILEIDGVGADKKAIIEYFDSRENPVQMDARQKMDLHDCGVDTATVVVCPHEIASEVDIPLDSLIGPQSLKKRSKLGSMSMES